MSIKIVQHLDLAQWQDFVDKHPHSNIFHTPEIWRAFARAKNHQPQLWAATSDDLRVLALFTPTGVTLANGRMHRLTTRMVAYGGVLCDESKEGYDALELLLTVYNRQVRSASLFTELRNQADTTSIQNLLERCHYVYEDHLNYLIDLTQPKQEIWHSLSSSARRNVRKAKKQGVTVKQIETRDGIVVFYKLLQMVYRHAKVALADQSLFESTFDILCPMGMAKFFLAQLGECSIGGRVVLIFKDTIYDWYAGADRTHWRCYPNDLLVWDILEWGIHQGFTRFNFGGAGKPGEKYGVRDFKAKFGGTLVNYGRNVCVHSPLLLRLSRAAYRMYRGLLGTGSHRFSSPCLLPPKPPEKQ